MSLRRRADRISGRRAYGGVLVVPCLVHDEYRYWFLVDTGTVLTTINRYVAEELGLDLDRPLRQQRIASVQGRPGASGMPDQFAGGSLSPGRSGSVSFGIASFAAGRWVESGTTAKVTRGAGFRACRTAWKGCSTCGFCPNAKSGSGTPWARRGSRSEYDVDVRQFRTEEKGAEEQGSGGAEEQG